MVEIVIFGPTMTGAGFGGIAQAYLSSYGKSIPLRFASWYSLAAKLRVRTIRVYQKLLDDLADGATLGLDLPGDASWSVAFPGMKVGLAALSACEATKLKLWGVAEDEAGRVAAKAKPINTSTWFAHVKSPRSVADLAYTGPSVLLMSVTADGKVSKCLPIGTSGSTALDTYSCSAFQANARFQPAADRDGKPVASKVVMATDWGNLPDLKRPGPIQAGY